MLPSDDPEPPPETFHGPTPSSAALRPDRGRRHVPGASGERWGSCATPGVLIVPLEREFGWAGPISIAISLNLFPYGLMGPFTPP